MRSVHDQLREHLLARAGVDLGRMPPLDSLRKTEQMPVFEQAVKKRLWDEGWLSVHRQKKLEELWDLCHIRTVMGAFRYGLLHDPEKPNYDRTASILKRLALFDRDRNAEHLVDAINIIMLEHAEGESTLEFRSADPPPLLSGTLYGATSAIWSYRKTKQASDLLTAVCEIFLVYSDTEGLTLTALDADAEHHHTPIR